MNKCDNCGWTGSDDQVVTDERIECDPGDTYPAGNCPECECHVYWYPDPKQCGFCGDKGYLLERDGVFEKCKQCNRFHNTFKALEYYIDFKPKEDGYDLRRFKFYPLPNPTTPTGKSQSPD